MIPCLLLKDLGLVKTVKFRNPRYLGDPINAVRIFNAKKTDELIFLDISAARENKDPSYDLIQKIGDECFMPFSVGGGIRDIENIKKILNSGAEKVVINSYSVENPKLITEASNCFGNQSIVVSIDAKKNFLGKYEVFIRGGTKRTGIDPVKHAQDMEKCGAGEIFLNSIDRDGFMEGFDIELINSVSNSVNIPTIACGGAGKLQDFSDVIKKGGASAAAGGSFFVFHGRKQAVLISYPTKDELKILMENTGLCRQEYLS